MIAVTVSDLDSFRRYRGREEMTLAELMKILRREAPPSEKMLAGRALHTLLETAATGNLERAESEGHTFTFALDAEISLTPIREIRGSREYRINGETVKLSGRADSIVGFHGYDHKLSGQFDAQRYHDSYQWRAYMAIFGLRAFTYNVFIGECKGQEWVIRDLHEITFYDYPELGHDMRRELTEYVDFAHAHLRAAA